LGAWGDDCCIGKKIKWSLFAFWGQHLGHKLRFPDPLKQTQDIGKFQDGIFFFKATYFHDFHYVFTGASVPKDYQRKAKQQQKLS
jgi:hypothetical protein